MAAILHSNQFTFMNAARKRGARWLVFFLRNRCENGRKIYICVLFTMKISYHHAHKVPIITKIIYKRARITQNAGVRRRDEPQQRTCVCESIQQFR